MKVKTVGTPSITMIMTLYRQRGLVAALVSRDVGARYRGTFLGYLWSLLNPLLLLTVYTVVFTVVLPARVSIPVPFPLFLFAGLLPWLFASGALLDAAIVLADNGPLLKKVVCPPEVFPTVKILSHLVHHLFALPVLVVGVTVAALLGRMQFPWTIFLVPLALVPWLISVSGMVFAIAALAIHFRDLKDLLQNLLNLVFFLTPIIYTPELVPAGILRQAVMANPVTPLVTVYRDAVLFGRVSPLSTWGWAFLVAVISWWLGTWVFWQLRETLAEAV